MTPALLAIALSLASSANPSGHWEGTVETPRASITIQVDFAQVDGALAGAITIPQQHLRNLPLTTIKVDGASITFGARSDQLLAGVLSEDGQTMSGTFSMDTYSFPFALARTGDGVVSPPPLSAHVGRELEGPWVATLADGGTELHLRLTIANRPDGAALATITNLDEGGLQLPVIVTTTGSHVTIESHVVESSFSGELAGSGELSGTFRQGDYTVPLTFRRNR